MIQRAMYKSFVSVSRYRTDTDDPQNLNWKDTVLVKLESLLNS
jgi:hypothetical protein